MSSPVLHAMQAERPPARPELPEDAAFYFSSAYSTLVARRDHVVEGLTCQAGGDLAGRVDARLRELRESGVEEARVVGALPFDTSQPAALWLLRGVERAPGLANTVGSPLPRGPLATAPGYGVRLLPAPEGYVGAVQQALHRIRSGELSKVVLARSLELALERPISRGDLMHQLAAQNETGYAFALELPGTEPRTLLGVTPELLLEKRLGKVLTNPLAGSRPRGHTREEDERLARTLLESPKDLREHALVVEAVVEALRPHCKELDVPRRPGLVSTATMWHLSTEIKGELRDERHSSLALAQTLHPTPAVCGFPREAAAKAIAELEGFERGMFAGLIGHADAYGDGEWVVTLRCAELRCNALRLYAGAGVVEGSDPWAEFDETRAKFGTVLRALGLVTAEAPRC